MDDGGVARVVVGIGIAPQVLLLEEHAQESLVAGPLPLPRLAHSRRERLDAFSRGCGVLPGIRDLRDQQSTFEEVGVPLRGETPKVLHDGLSSRRGHSSFRAIATPSRSGTITLEKSGLAKSRRLNSRIPSVAGSRTESSTTRPDQRTLSASRYPPGRTRGAAASSAAG